MRVKRARWLLPVGVVAGALVIGAAGCPPAPQPTLHSKTFNCTGSATNFQVPAGVTALVVHAYGAQGGRNIDMDSAGGLGGRAIGGMQVTPGQNVAVAVGCKGSDGPGVGGFPGGGSGILQGGGGGGASVVVGTTTFIGGGGGGASGGINRDGGTGGAPAGGNGGGLAGTFGTGGTQTTGGFGPGAATDGSSLDGGSAAGPLPGGGGGGGGLFGGGGGIGSNGSGGGGGGSSTGPSGTTYENGVETGNGHVILYWFA